jgi:acylphosphatase
MRTPSLSLTLFLSSLLGAVAAADGPRQELPVKMVARLVHYSGRVQGVGFRAEAVAIARDFPVTGWVQNLPDGRVRLLVEGPEEAVQRFLAAVRKRWEKNIEKEQVEEQKPSGAYRDFAVRQ